MEQQHLDGDLDVGLDITLEEPPPVEEPPRRPGGGPGWRPTGRVWPWFLAIGLGVAIERLSMITFVTDAGPEALLLSALLFLTVPAVAGFVVVRAFYAQREHDARARARRR